ncbi:MAG: AAA family ATPase [Magnetococcus sp. DMHC-1]|nr:AAA family ATPase [Magnetococcales bacterium]
MTPDTELFFGGGNRELILKMLIQSILAGEGIVKVVGEVGSGKTMLCRTLGQHLSGQVEVAMLINPHISPAQVATTILQEFRLTPDPSGNQTVNHQLLLNHLVALHRSGRQAVVLVEEAHGMPMATLEELRLLSNLETTRTKLLQIVLFGQPELDRILAAHENRQFLERITTSFHLSPLSLQETEHYLQRRLWATGYQGQQLFTKRAVRHLFLISRGSIRKINILAHKALLAAFTELAVTVHTRHVRSAIASSEFFPGTLAWYRPMLAAAGLMAVIVGGTLLHSWGNTAPQTAEKFQDFQSALSDSLPGTRIEKDPGFISVRTARSKDDSKTFTPASGLLSSSPDDVFLSFLDIPAIQGDLTGKKMPLVDTFPSSRNKGQYVLPGKRSAPYDSHPYMNRGDPYEERILAAHSWIETSENAHFTIQLMVLPGDTILANFEKNMLDLIPEIRQRKLHVMRLLDNRLLVFLDEFSSWQEAENIVQRLAKVMQTQHPYVIPVQQAREKVYRLARFHG